MYTGTAAFMLFAAQNLLTPVHKIASFYFLKSVNYRWEEHFNESISTIFLLFSALLN